MANFFKKRSALKVVAEPNDGTFKIVIGGRYPGMYAQVPDMLTVEHMHVFESRVIVNYRTKSGIKSAESIQEFCGRIAGAVAYERNSMQSVDVSKYFLQ